MVKNPITNVYCRMLVIELGTRFLTEINSLHSKFREHLNMGWKRLQTEQ